MPGESKTSPRRIEAAIRAAKALDLRCQGWTYCEIAKELGYSSRVQAHKAVCRTLDKMQREPAERLRQIEDARLDKKHKVLASKVKDGNIAAVGMDLKVQERRARLHGLDAPVQAAIDVDAPWVALLRDLQGGDEASNAGGEAEDIPDD